MTDPVTLHGYRFSVYTRIARVVLAEKGVLYTRSEIDPFAGDLPDGYLRLHPFARVPVLTHGAFALYETGAIARYVDAAFDGPKMVPTRPEALARMAQVIAIVDNYGYIPMIRQVFAHRVFRPLHGGPTDEAEVAAGIAVSPTILKALEDIAKEGLVLNGEEITLADCHLGPMMDYFTAAPEGAEMINAFRYLHAWWAWMSPRPAMITSDPGRG